MSTSQTDYVLEVTHLTKHFNNFQAVKGISFSVEKGKIVGFLGPNGAGKTTTIQMLLGVLIPTHGNIVYFGKDLEIHRQEIMEKVNFSSTYVHMPWRVSVYENLTYTSYLYDISDRKKRVNEIIETFRLNSLRNKEVSQLSEGQKTRLMLAKGFINKPKVLLLDEPTASMDPETADYIRNFILEYRENNDISILFTSHNMSEIEEVCDDVIFLKEGSIVAHDTPSNLAKKIQICHVSLVIKDGLKRAESICQERKLHYKTTKRHITIDLKEKEIPQFLNNLLEKGIEYTEISIDKPSLEDFFLAVSKKQIPS